MWKFGRNTYFHKRKRYIFKTTQDVLFKIWCNNFKANIWVLWNTRISNFQFVGEISRQTCRWKCKRNLARLRIWDRTPARLERARWSHARQRNGWGYMNGVVWISSRMFHASSRRSTLSPKISIVCSKPHVPKNNSYRDIIVLETPFKTVERSSWLRVCFASLNLAEPKCSLSELVRQAVLDTAEQPFRSWVTTQ